MVDSRTADGPRMAEIMKPHLISKEHAKVVADAKCSAKRLSVPSS